MGEGLSKALRYSNHFTTRGAQLLPFPDDRSRGQAGLQVRTAYRATRPYPLFVGSQGWDRVILTSPFRCRGGPTSPGGVHFPVSAYFGEKLRWGTITPQTQQVHSSALQLVSVSAYALGLLRI